MHEMMLAESILKSISTETEKQKARPLSAKISCGTLNAVNDELLIFAFEAAAKNTVCEGMKLQIEHKLIQARCGNCGQTFTLELLTPNCPECGGSDFDLLPDEPLMLEEIEFETE